MADPTLSDWQANIGGSAGVTIGKGTAYIINDFEFFGQSARTLDTPRANAPGDYTTQDYLGSRVGTIKVTVTGATPTEAMNNYNALVGQWWMRASETVRPLQFKLPGQPQQQMLGKPRRFNPDMSRLLASIVTVDLEYYTPGPAIVSADPVTGSTTLSAGVGGRTYPRVYPMTYGSVGAQPAVVTNDGNYTVWPVVTIYGPCANPIAVNTTQGKSIKVSLTLAGGDFLVIDMDAHAILLNGTASRRYAMTSDSQWWSLDPGQSSLRFLADVYQAAAHMDIQFNSAWVG